MINVEKVRSDFPLLSQTVHGKPIAYLDNAATTLKPLSVIDAVDRHYRMGTANVHRGVHYLSEKATAEFEATRKAIQNFIHAAYDHEIIFTRGTTESINLVASGFGKKFLKSGDEILISHMEHHSNIVPWQILRDEKGCSLNVIPITDEGELDMIAFERLLSRKTRLVAITHVSNTLGTINDIRKIIAMAHDMGAVVLIDGAQAVSSQKVDVQSLNCDFYAFSSHKLFGPTGVGVLYGKSKWLDALPPYQAGGDMIASVTFEKTTYNSLPYKFEAGTPAIAGVIGFKHALDYVQNIGLDAIAAYEEELRSYGTRILQDIQGLRLIGQARKKIAILSFSFADIHPHDIGTLVDREGIAIRTGHLCTQPLMNRFDVPAVARASLSLYNTREELDRLANALVRVKETFE